MRRLGSTYVKGAFCGFAAASIWAGWSVLTRLAVTTRLDEWDIVALRFGVAGILLLPVAMRHGLARGRLGWRGLAVLVAGAGVPYVLLAAGGLRFAPAHDQAALNPGVAPLFVALIAAAVLHERPSATGKIGLTLIAAGVVAIVSSQAVAWNASRLVGHGLFLSASFLWACFTVVARRAEIGPLHATALVSVGSAILYLPTYLVMRGDRLAAMPLAEIAMQTVFHGILVTIVSLVLYGRAVAILGASGGAAFGALAPALSALFAIPLLGEWPSGADWIGIALISAGVYLASGAPVPTKQ